MHASELADNLAAEYDLPKSKAKAIVNSLFEGIQKTLKKGETVSITGFGTFGLSRRAARKGRNPHTGGEIKIAAKTVPRFKAGKGLKDAVAKTKV